MGDSRYKKFESPMEKLFKTCKDPGCEMSSRHNAFDQSGFCTTPKCQAARKRSAKTFAHYYGDEQWGKWA